MFQIFFMKMYEEDYALVAFISFAFTFHLSDQLQHFFFVKSMKVNEC